MAGSVTEAVQRARANLAHMTKIEVEVDTLEQLDEALALRAELVLLDNFTPEQCAEAVRRSRAAGGITKLESSGGLTLQSAREYAETGVDYVAVGALTHSVIALDLGMDLVSANSQAGANAAG
jgi:nicotinate-nucleotide pyrophosphorylase (carboxylating)